MIELLQVSQTTSQAPMSGIFIAAITAVVTLGSVYLKDYLSSKNRSESDIEIAKINSRTDDSNEIKEELKKALESMKALRSELDIERDFRAKIESKFRTVKVAFNIIFSQYAQRPEFKEDPESMVMLEQLKEIIEEDIV